jgi:hypothetical protein
MFIYYNTNLLEHIRNMNTINMYAKSYSMNAT